MKKITTILFTKNATLERNVLEVLKCFNLIKVLCIVNDQYLFLEKMRLLQPEFLIIEISDYNVDIDWLDLIQKPSLAFAITEKEHFECLLEKGFIDIIGKDFTKDLLVKKIYKIIRLVTKLSQMTFSYSAEENVNEYLSKTKDYTHSLDFLFVKYKKLSEKIHYSDILFMRNNKNMIEIITTSEKIFYHQSSLKKFYKKLPLGIFTKINNAVIVNYHKIDTMKNAEVTIQKYVFKVTRVYAQRLKELLRIL
jgi:DNA-binding LytR/AlgR family response regulator